MAYKVLLAGSLALALPGPSGYRPTPLAGLGSTLDALPTRRGKGYPLHRCTITLRLGSTFNTLALAAELGRGPQQRPPGPVLPGGHQGGTPPGGHPKGVLSRGVPPWRVAQGGAVKGDSRGVGALMPASMGPQVPSRPPFKVALRVFLVMRQIPITSRRAWPCLSLRLCLQMDGVTCRCS